MVTKPEEKNKEYPKRTRATLRYRIGREDVELPVEVSCRADGECVIRHPRMENLIFPKVAKKGEKPHKKEVKK